MNKEKFDKVYEKFISGYYHKNSTYKYKKDDKYEIYNMDFEEIVIDLLECNIKDEDIIDWKKFEDIIDYGIEAENLHNNNKTYEALKYLAKYYELKNESIENSLKNKEEYEKYLSIRNIVDNEDLEEILNKPGMAFIIFKRNGRIAHQNFKMVQKSFFHAMKSISDGSIAIDFKEKQK